MISPNHGRRSQRDSAVSVIIPAHNAERFLGEALDSVFAQGCDGLEVIVVDDGSSDGTGSLAQRYGRGVRLLRQERSGSGAARNAGLGAASGELIAFLDADDVWMEGKLAAQLPLLGEDPRVALVFSDLQGFDADGPRARTWFEECGFSGRCVSSSIFLHDMIMTSSVVLRRSCLDRAGTFDPSLPIGQDTDLWFRIALAEKIDVVPRPLVRYRHHAGNTTRDERTLARCVVEVWSRYMKACIETEPEMRGRLESDFADKLHHHLMLEGCALLKEGRSGEARRQFARAIGNSPLDARAWGFYLAALGRRAQGSMR